MDKEATSYFRKLNELLLGIQTTDRHDGSLSINEGAARAVDIILSVAAKHGKAMVIGNGGSAAIASHMQNDLLKAVGLRAMDFSQVPLLTALGNDLGYEYVYEQPVKLWADEGDLMVAISSSGESENILTAVRAAADRDCRIITLSGFRDNNSLRKLGEVNFYVASSEYGYVESAHSTLAHFLTDRAVMVKSGK